MDFNFKEIHETIRISKGRIKIGVMVSSGMDGDYHIIISPTLSVSGYGKTEKEAIESFDVKKNAIISVTLGKNGTLLYYQGKFEIVPSISIEAIDTTGAGDAFIGAVLKQICDKTPENFDEVKNYVSFANKVAAISTTKFGAIEAMPTLEQISKI